MIHTEKKLWLNFSTEMDSAGLTTKLAKEITELTEKYPEEWITLFITSGGGLVGVGVAFYEFIVRVLNPKLQTVVLGEVSSAALLMFLSGAKRTITQNSTIFFHDIGKKFQEGTRLDRADMRFFLRDMDIDHGKYARIVAGRSDGKLSVEKTEELMLAKTTLNAEQALEYGLAHEIL